MPRELTNKELRKLKMFRGLLDEDIIKSKSTFFGKIDVFFSDAEYKRDFVCEGIEAFLTCSIEEMRKEKEGE